MLRQVDVRLPGKGNSNSHGARPVHQIMSTIKWIGTSKLSIKESLPPLQGAHAQLAAFFAEDAAKFKPEELYSQLLSFLSQLDKAALVGTPQRTKCAAVPRRARI